MLCIKIALVDDQVLFLRGLRLLLGSSENIEIVLEAPNGRVLMELLEKQQPNIILMDLNMPELDGIETTKLVKEQYPDIKVILLTMYDDEQLINHLMQIGANGYLLKNEEPEILIEAIESVFAKDFYFNEYVSTALLKAAQNRQKKFKKGWEPSAPIELTPRENEVLELICKELTTSEIANKLFISTRTVEGHRKNLLEKTGARNTAGLIIYAVKNNLIEITV